MRQETTVVLSRIQGSKGLPEAGKGMHRVCVCVGGSRAVGGKLS